MCVHNCYKYALCRYIPTLPSTIDSTAAANSIRSQGPLLVNLVSHCLLSLANSLYAQFIITRDVHKKACNQSLEVDERARALLDSVEARVEAVPSDFGKFVQILSDDSFLNCTVEMLLKSYGE